VPEVATPTYPIDPEKHLSDPQIVKTKRTVTTVSVLASGGLALLKLIVGILSGSLGLLAEAAHSFLDLASTLITYWVIQTASAPPDDNHPYGHERAEELGALAGMILLGATAVIILYHAFIKICFHPSIPNVTTPAFAVLIASGVVDYFRSRALKSAAAEFQSKALASDAIHFFNDLLGILAVLSCFAVVRLADLLHIPNWLVSRADAVAAIVVACIALKSVWTLGQRAVRSLMDETPHELTEQLRECVEKIEGVVKGSTEVRTRFVGSRPYVEVKIGTPRGGSLESAHHLSSQIEEQIGAQLPNAHATVHIEPQTIPNESYAASVRAIADRLGLRVHNLNIFLLAKNTRIELDLEVADDLSLAEAHKHSEALETEIIEELGNAIQITIHLEPRNDAPKPAALQSSSTQLVQQALSQLSESENVLLHDVLVVDDGLVVTLERKFPGNTSLREAHEKMSELETKLRAAVPEVIRVHTNPAET
jgi:cation diffusion facilitator family transporter